jgi:hypothetical protein
MRGAGDISDDKPARHLGGAGGGSYQYRGGGGGGGPGGLIGGMMGGLIRVEVSHLILTAVLPD